MFPEIELTEECRRVLHECESEAHRWGLSVCVRDCCEVPELQLRGCLGMFIPSADASRFGIPAGCGLAAVDVGQLRGLWDPVGRVVSVAAHEIAHAVQDDLETICFGPAIETAEGSEAKIWTPERLQRVGRPAWSGHGPDFVRACVHVIYRLRCAGLTPEERWCFAPDVYGVSSLERYTEALQGEPERLAGVPIVAALQGPAPGEFLRQWAADIARAAAQNSLGSSRQSLSLCHSSEEPSSTQT